jgi:hypothetical protein
MIDGMVNYGLLHHFDNTQDTNLNSRGRYKQS